MGKLLDEDGIFYPTKTIDNAAKKKGHRSGPWGSYVMILVNDLIIKKQRSFCLVGTANLANLGWVNKAWKRNVDHSI